MVSTMDVANHWICQKILSKCLIHVIFVLSDGVAVP